MDSVVLDASSLLALIQQEPGGERVLDAIDDVTVPLAISSINFCEVATKLVRDGVIEEDVTRILEPFRKYVVDFNLQDAELAAELHRITRAIGLSLGDRACLAPALRKSARVLTADRPWSTLKLEVKIELIR